MDQRDRDRRGDGGVRRDAGRTLRRQGLHLAGEHHIEEVAHAAPMGQLRALRGACGARGVEDAGVGVGIDLDVRQRAALGDHFAPERGPFRRRVRPDGHQLRLPQHSGLLADPGDALGVREQELRLGVGQSVGHLRSRPPGVHADRGHADAGASPIDQHPFRIVAHGDRHPVAGFHALGQHPVGDRGDEFVRLAVGDPLVPVDQVVAVPEGGGGKPDRPHVRRGVLEGSHGRATHLDLGNLEGGAWLCELLPGLVQFRIVHAPLHPRLAPASGGRSPGMS